MKAIERLGLSNLLSRKNRTSLQPTQRDFDGMSTLERQCYVSLAGALGKRLPPEMLSDYIGTTNEFSPKITELRAYLSSAKSPIEGSDYLFDSFYSLHSRLAADEPELQVDCENEKELIDQLYEAANYTFPYFTMPHYYTTRILSRMNYAQVDITEPSLDIGIGDGLTARFVFSDRRIDIGSDLFIRDLVEAKRHEAPFDRLMAFDVANIPFLDNTFGSVFSMNTIYHSEDKIAAIHEMARVLAPGGTLCFNDISSNFVSERPFVLALKDSRVFQKSANDFLPSILKPQRYLGPNEYREILLECGCDDIEVIPYMSLPLYKITYFFYDLERFFAMNSVNPGSRRVKSLMSFLHSVVAPLLARDHELSQTEGGVFWLVHATKRGRSDLQVTSKNVMQRTICPACRSRLASVADKFRCTSCAIEFPAVNDIPIISTAYLNSFDKLIEERD
jgi:SAM-dependent methyltransferase